MKQALRALAIIAALSPGIAAAQTLPPGTVQGRLPPIAGPVEAIPFSVLLSQLQLYGNIVLGPGTAPTAGNFAVWGSSLGTLADGGTPGTLAHVNGGTGVATAAANALNAAGGLIGFGGNIGAASGASLALTGTLSAGQFVIGTGTNADAFTVHGQQNFYFPNLASDPGCFCNTFVGNGGANLTHATVNYTAPGVSTTATVTITIASPGVITWTAHGLAAQTPVVFTSTGALPTGITSGTTYYVSAAGLTTNTFEIAATQGGSVINTTGSQSGTQTGYTISLEGRYNISLGQQALPAITNGAYNSAGGFETMFNCTSCAWNTGWGEATLFSNVAGNADSAFGWKALLSNLDSNNSAFGFGAMLNQTIGPNNSSFGYRAQYGAASATMSGDSSFGASAGTNLLSGVNNSLFGFGAGSSVTTGSNNTLLGANNNGTAALANEIRISDGTGALGFRSDASRNTYLGDGVTGRNVYNYFATSSNNNGTAADASGNWTVFTGTSGTSVKLTVAPDGSTTLGAPTGGNKGAGTLNTAGPIYVNGTGMGAPYFRAYLSADQSLVTGTTTKIAFDTDDFDTASAYSLSTHVFTPLVAGTYQVCTSAFPSGTFTAAPDNFIMWISKNGTIGGTGVSQLAFLINEPTATGDGSSASGCALVQMNGSTDTLEIDANVTATSPKIRGASARGSQFSATRIGP